MLTFGSLFSGIGGLDLGLERAGMICKWQVEIDEYCQRLLIKHWPDVPKHRDIRLLDTGSLERVDIICGGFPCQDISNAGRRAGIDGERSGLWSEYARIVRALRPRIVLVENVAALLGRGMGRVLGDLAACGYDAEWDVLPAAAFGAPHLRERVFIVAHDRKERIQRVFTEKVSRVAAFSWCQDVGRVENLRDRPDIPASLFRGASDGIPNWMDRIGGLGNAVVPQVAEWIGNQIIKSLSA